MNILAGGKLKTKNPTHAPSMLHPTACPTALRATPLETLGMSSRVEPVLYCLQDRPKTNRNSGDGSRCRAGVGGGMAALIPSTGATLVEPARPNLNILSRRDGPVTSRVLRWLREDHPCAAARAFFRRSLLLRIAQLHQQLA